MRNMAGTVGLNNAVVINTCAVTQQAVSKSRQEIRRLRRENPNSTLIVTGCAAQIDPKSFSKMGEVDFVLGNSEKMRPEIWSNLASGATVESRRIQVDDIMSISETASHLIDGLELEVVLMYKFKMGAIIVVHFAQYHLVEVILDLFLLG